MHTHGCVGGGGGGHLVMAVDICGLVLLFSSLCYSTICSPNNLSIEIFFLLSAWTKRTA